MYTRKDITRLAIASKLTGYEDKNLIIPTLSKKDRQEVIHSSNNVLEKEIAAAVEIQRTWRGHRVRALFLSFLRSTSNSRSYASSRSETLSPTTSDQLEHFSSHTSKVSTRLYNLSQEKLQWESKNDLMKTDTDEDLTRFYKHSAASTTQKLSRDIHVTELKKDVLVQNGKDRKSSLSVDEAVDKIQKFWRKHIDLQVFKYYRDLISFRNAGNPQYMLRCINPKEADLLDDGSGIHVRFRLGGFKFPPNVYYKIFTHLNVADIGSFAPRNYTNPSSKQLPGKFVHHTELCQIETDDEEAWYKRQENNGWRLVNKRILRYIDSDPVAYETRQQKINFPHEKIVRRKDLEIKKKRKKIEWMKKMYAAGMFEANREVDKEIKELVHTAAEGLLTSAEKGGSEMIEDWEVDELLEWTQGLNFESYLQDWKEHGTTSFQKGVCAGRDPISVMIEDSLVDVIDAGKN